ncbi:hypothetical protein [Sinorhizobium alkalisoli]|uniref:Uncharacterized protein n=1 Tax=Sinorhizobium alkalisoli TaxID=1752398 RepID=A0A1E3V8X7_9HYPH|nr:hypothetical protein [Sinorhizobium alkalisoli]MCA1489951.1 hypothetical protein [Ensifer sp. NBAIM29]MCG5477678.1 hypothetical protein [Sinorhizobium alkalisoli]ODR89276.1 hypothetical protein A8M32_22835 [Sinorhizobium alkalisoli]
MGDNLVPNGLSMVAKSSARSRYFLDAKPLAGHDGRDVDLLAMHADAAAGGNHDVAIVGGFELRQTVIGP